ncbi:RICIN domain-containing protein [Streptomyces sp. NPDC059982]|uniref:RICIN domain-containing protein n=1 Tax=unclassified Streptomyces TaxID=2593676 RepID=UPI0036C3B5C7
MRVRCVILLAAASLFLPAASALAVPTLEYSASTYIYNNSSGRPVTGLWPPGCFAANPTPCAGLQLSPDTGSAYYFAGDRYRYVQIHWGQGKCWDLLNGGLTNGTPITLNTCSQSKTQEWYVPGGFGATYDIVISVGSPLKCLDADNPEFPNPPKAGARLQIWDCIRTPNEPNRVNQLWRFDPHIWGY